MDKNKIIEAAAKLVAKGAYDKAIKEYQKILEVDPKDVRILQKMGELYQKKNDNVQAATYFTKVAESYSTDGFFLKAVALYKQVLKLNPNLIEVNLKLAELHQQLQLMSEAMSYYQIVANHYDKAGDTKSSLDTLKKMVDLDPENVASRKKLAELYARENMNAQAIAEFNRCAEYLRRNGRVDDYLQVAERISALEPSNVPLARELAEKYLERGDQKRALAKLQICFKADPQDVDTLKLLASAFHGLGQISKTLSVWKELAKVYGEKGQRAEADQVWRQIEALDPNDPEVIARRGAPAAAAPAPPRPAPSTAPPRPAPAAAPAPAAPAPAAPAPAAPAPRAAPAVARDQLGKLLTETDVYVKYGLHEKALEHLRKIFAVDPENLDAHEKAYNIYVAANNPAQASEQLLNVLRLCTRRNEVERAQPYLATILRENPHHPEVPAFVAVLGGEQPEPTTGEVVPDDAILVDSNDEEVVVSEAPPDALAVEDVALHTAAGFDSDEVVSDDLAFPAEDEPLVAPAPEVEDEPLEVADPALELQAGGDEVSAEIVEEPGLEVEPEQFADEPVVPEAAMAEAVDTDTQVEYGGAAFESPVEPPEEAPPAEEPVSEEAVSEEPASEECDEAEFFIDQGLADEAREILETVLIAFPGHRRAAKLLQRLEEAAPAAPAPAAPSAPPSVSPVEEERDAFDLAAELASELGDADEVVAPAEPAEEFQYSVEEVFSEFKKGLAKVVKPEDVDTHYDLGIAYKEMGLLDDAINEFTVARQGCLGAKKEIDCLTMIGLLQLSRGDHGAAIDAFKQALVSEHGKGDAEKGLRYELGAAHEAAGNLGKALFHFQACQALDPKYRDVASRASRLSARAKPEQDPLPARVENGVNGVHGAADDGGGPKPKGGAKPAEPGKARKVGYV